jgi:hypothetical protein
MIPLFRYYSMDIMSMCVCSSRAYQNGWVRKYLAIDEFFDKMKGIGLVFNSVLRSNGRTFLSEKKIQTDCLV